VRLMGCRIRSRVPRHCHRLSVSRIRPVNRCRRSALRNPERLHSDKPGQPDDVGIDFVEILGQQLPPGFKPRQVAGQLHTVAMLVQVRDRQHAITKTNKMRRAILMRSPPRLGAARTASGDLPPPLRARPDRLWRQYAQPPGDPTRSQELLGFSVLSE